MNKIIPKEKFKIMNDLSLAVSCACEKAVYHETESQKQVKQEVANHFIRDNLSVKKHKYYKTDDRVKLKHLHLTKDAIILIAGRYLYIKGENYYSFEDIDVNEKVVSVWFLSEEDVKIFQERSFKI